MKRILSLFVALAMANGVIKAQLYGNDVFYYVPAGQSISDNTSIYIVFFSGRRICSSEVKRSTVIYKLSQDPHYYVDEARQSLEKGGGGKYNSSLSTSSRVVYENDWYGSPQNAGTPSDPWRIHQPLLGTYYRAFSKDKSSMIEWRERKNSGEVENKTYYKLVDLKEILPKAANHDFLYE